MGKQSKREYLVAIVKRYRLATKKEKREILDEFCTVCEYNRKYAIRLLRRGEMAVEQGKGKPVGRRKKYDVPIILEVFKREVDRCCRQCQSRFDLSPQAIGLLCG